MSDYAGPAEGVMRRRRQRAEKAAEDAPRGAPKRKRANEGDVARGGEPGVGDARAGASARGASGVAASRGAPARAGRGGAAGAAPARASLARGAKSRRPLAGVDPNRQRDPLGARDDGAGGARGAPATRARAKAGVAAERRAQEGDVPEAERAEDRREAEEATDEEDRGEVDEAVDDVGALARAAAGQGDWPPGVPEEARAAWVDAVQGRHALAGVPAEGAVNDERHAAARRIRVAKLRERRIQDVVRAAAGLGD